MMRISGKRIYLRILNVDDDLTSYLKWMNNSEVVQFMESRGKLYGLKDLKEYIQSVSNERNYFFGIFLKNGDHHIGNIKLGNIHPYQKRANIGVLIGEKSFWGKGFASEAIEAVTVFAFQKLNLKKVTAGMYANNIGSYKAFLKSGFKECGRLEEHNFFEGGFVDGIIVEKINSGYKVL